VRLNLASPCAPRDKALDLGAFTLAPVGMLLVSDQATGTTGFLELPMAHHGKAARPTQRPEWNPRMEFLD